MQHVNDSDMKIGICCDHTGVEYKSKLISYLLGKGYEIVNFGTDSTESCDYPDYAALLADALAAGECDCGIALCGTGNGMAIALNHFGHVRAGLAWNQYTARMVKAHNHANVVVLPARCVSYNMAVGIVRTWLATEMEGGRHERRVAKINTGLSR